MSSHSIGDIEADSPLQADDLEQQKNALVPKGIGADEQIPEGISFDNSQPKYRQYRGGDHILEYTLDGDKITVDWVSGRNAAKMMQAILVM